MPSWNSRGLRGSLLEEMLNMTNERYREKRLAVVQKIPTPITPIEIDKTTRHITLAYFEQKSTVDYVGAIQGIPVCFDAKECAYDTFALQNVHEHQIKFMEEFEGQGGISFLIIFYSKKNLFYYMRFKELKKFADRAADGGRKSICFDELNEKYKFFNNNGLYIPYLDMINLDLEERDD